jgi:hypothetical protein
MRKVKITNVDDGIRAIWAQPEVNGDLTLFIEAMHGYLGDSARTEYGVADVENPLVPTRPRRLAFLAGRRLKP